MNWVEVTKAEYYERIGKLDVYGRFVNSKYPYTTEHVTTIGRVQGKIVGYIPEGTALEQKRYYLLK